MVKIAPSLLSADYTQLLKQIVLAEKGGADILHVDVMDGHFVPNITVGPIIVQAVRRCTELPIDVHLMVEHPENFIKAFANSGANYITVHVEARHDIEKTIGLIRSLKKKPGIVINPDTAFHEAVDYLSTVDMILVMTVNPGFPGQRFMPEVVPKIKQAKEYIRGKGLAVELEVDGGISQETARDVARAGADILVAGSAIFGGNIAKRVRNLRVAAEG